MNILSISNRPWFHYSKKMTNRILAPLYTGALSNQEALSKEMVLITKKTENMDEGIQIVLYLLFDPSDGIVADAKFQLYGPACLIAFLDAICQWCMRRDVRSLSSITSEKIEEILADKKGQSCWSKEDGRILALAIEFLKQLTSQVQEDMIQSKATPIPSSTYASDGHLEWKICSKSEKMALIENVLNEEIRPYIEMDAGGITVLELTDEDKLIIAYQGSCTSCYSAVGTTLSAIQDMLQTKLSPTIQVIPDAQSLTFS